MCVCVCVCVCACERERERERESESVLVCLCVRTLTGCSKELLSEIPGPIESRLGQSIKVLADLVVR